MLWHKKMSVYLNNANLSVLRLFEDIHNSVGGHGADFFFFCLETRAGMLFSLTNNVRELNLIFYVAVFH